MKGTLLYAVPPLLSNINSITRFNLTAHAATAYNELSAVVLWDGFNQPYSRAFTISFSKAGLDLLIPITAFSILFCMLLYRSLSDLSIFRFVLCF